MTADDIVRLLDLKPHPEGGHFRETFRDDGHPRGASTAIYYLLKAGELSHWHRVDQPKSGIGTPATRLRFQSPGAAPPKLIHSAQSSPQASARRSSYRNTHGRARARSAAIRSPDARSRPRSPSRVSRWRRRTGDRLSGKSAEAAAGSRTTTAARQAPARRCSSRSAYRPA